MVMNTIVRDVLYWPCCVITICVHTRIYMHNIYTHTHIYIYIFFVFPCQVNRGCNISVQPCYTAFCSNCL